MLAKRIDEPPSFRKVRKARKSGPRKRKRAIRKVNTNTTAPKLLAAKWQSRMEARILEVRPRLKKRAASLAKQMVHKSLRVLYGMKIRAKKRGSEWDLSFDDLMEMYIQSYYSQCRYCQRALMGSNMVVDHIVPISSGGATTKGNLQIICKTCNNVKGSLSEDQLAQLLSWLNNLPEAFAKNIKTRLAGGIA